MRGSPCLSKSLSPLKIASPRLAPAGFATKVIPEVSSFLVPRDVRRHATPRRTPVDLDNTELSIALSPPSAVDHMPLLPPSQGPSPFPLSRRKYYIAKVERGENIFFTGRKPVSLLCKAAAIPGPQIMLRYWEISPPSGDYSSSRRSRSHQGSNYCFYRYRRGEY